MKRKNCSKLLVQINSIILIILLIIPLNLFSSNMLAPMGSAEINDLSDSVTKSLISQFIEQIEQPVVIGEHKSISGGSVRRCSGTLVIRSMNGKEQTIVFVGTVHDFEVTTWEFLVINDRGDGTGRFAHPKKSISPTEAEKEFVANIVAEYPDIINILLEQGSFDLEGNLGSWLIGLSQEKNQLGRLVKNGLENYSISFKDLHHGELGWITQEALAKGMKVSNMDLSENIHAVQYFVNMKGIQEAVYWGFNQIMRVFGKQFAIEHPDFIPRIVHYWFASQEIDILFGDIEEFYQEYIKNYTLINQLGKVTNSFRDEYMTRNILDIKGNIIIIAHTRHILGIIRRLIPHSISFQPGKIELAEGTFDTYRTQELWESKGIRSQTIPYTKKEHYESHPQESDRSP